MYQKMMRAIGKLIKSISTTTNIDIRCAAKSYEHYSNELLLNFDYSVSYKIGDVCWVEFGNNLMPEMSYSHMAVIMKRFGKLYYALPITTLDRSKPLMADAYHPVYNPAGKKEYFFMKGTDYSFLSHDSVIKLSDLKSISVKRIKTRCGSMPSDDFNILENIIFKKFFPSEDRQINLLLKENSILKMKLELSNIPNEIEDMSQISISSVYSTEITKEINNKVNIKLTDAYNQTVIKDIIIKHHK